MNFTTQIVIACPREQVIDLIRKPEHLVVWQPGWRYGKMMVGEPDQVGSRRQVFVELPGIKLEMVETVVAYDPPGLFASTFTARGVTNRVENRFYSETAGATRWVMGNTLRFSGLMAVAGGFIADYVPKQTVASMQRFKQFAEHSCTLC